MSAPQQAPGHIASRRPVQRVGIFGGTFDPVHMAHLRCAEEAREALGLDRVLFIPAATPPHKTGRCLAAAKHRLAMVRLAIAGNPAFRVSTIELERPGRSYTVDTVRLLRARMPQMTRFVLLLGLDAFLEMGTWKEYRSLFSLADMAVMSRPSYRLAAPRASLPVAVRREFCYGLDRRMLFHESGTQIVFLKVTPLDLSASAIRSRLQRGQSVRYLVPSAVERYLLRERLYVRGSTSS